MTVFLTPVGEPFWGGTYFPPDERMGMPSFRRVLAAVADAYATRPDQITKATTAMRDLYATTARSVPAGTLTADTLTRAYEAAVPTYDTRHGGFGRAPKFPPTMLLEFVLTQWVRGGHGPALEMAHDTFAKMAAGGIHDQVGGGFHRYAVDTTWLTPHFEKMLYDNALLARCGAHVWQATRDDAVRDVTVGILRWVQREMTSPEFGFYASLDADSEGHEGVFYTWTANELNTMLGDDAAAVRAWFGVTADGNFEGRNILHVPGDVHVAAARAHVDPSDILRAVDRSVARLYEVRSKRVWPARDDKIIASWNGLMLRGVAACARAFGGIHWMTFAQKNAEFLATHLVHDDRVSRIWARGEARVSGFLEDYAAIGLGFFEVWQLTGERAWLDRARRLASAIASRFWDEALPGFYDVPADHEALITRPRDVLDNAMPSGSSLATELFLLIGYVTGEARFERMATAAMGGLAESLARHPHAFGHLLAAADFAVHGASAVAVVGSGSTANDMTVTANRTYLPAGIVARAANGTDQDLSLFAERDSRTGAAAAYVCRGHVCDAPATTPAELAERLATLTRSPRST